jgi:hypothetical protein
MSRSSPLVFGSKGVFFYLFLTCLLPFPYNSLLYYQTNAGRDDLYLASGLIERVPHIVR